MRLRNRSWEGLVVVAVALASVGLNTDFRSPPRYDGAGYSVLALSIMTGRGYRGIDHPEAPPHSHFPPGYPLALAGLWSVTGRSVVAAHGFSLVCTVGASLLAWRWFRQIEPPRVADLLGLAMAINWTWGAVGGSIQSEPMYLLLSMAGLNLARRPGLRNSVILGAIFGLATLTRHVGICLIVAVILDRMSRRSWREAIAIGATAALVMSPWIAWLATARRETQLGLFASGGLGPVVSGQALFYLRRLPDALGGPFVEVATVFSRWRGLGSIATLAAALASTLLLVGLIRATRTPRTRLVGLVPLVTLPLLIVWPFTEAGRFLIPLVPCLLVGMVEGLLMLGRMIRLGGSRRPAAALLLVLAVPYSAYAIVTQRAKAQQRTHADFDAACRWIALEARRPGPVLTRHPGEVFWQAGRLAVAPSADDPEGLARQVAEQGVAYLLIDPDRFANAPESPLARLVRDRPGGFRRVFEGTVTVEEVQPR